ncbi:erythroid differentiation-related factor 1 isoform X2 [Ornithorhynchus anatinus]|uniref:erythroid differentiation-related factor 1 isoform X2 n=1 Tax=Ornithorhynchus anatinus TaxID=9258 RepID=UPI0010A7DB3A|nr:erythroid differentiation-related factor 1 isoform X2 [Ornithorhynchus anatinus]
MGDPRGCGPEAPGPLEDRAGPLEDPPQPQGSGLVLGSGEVKSRAVVKYSAAPARAAFAQLEEKTDLKLPPANWLRESAKLGPAGTTILGTGKKSKPFSSFGMAYDFIDSVGNDVDVVSDSENIKKLLKIPYSKSHVSMAVHRVGRTLLLDELDIQELFMRSSQTGDWTWLKEFYQRLIDQKWQRKKKSKEHWYQKAILSKFLYYSINGDGAAQQVPAAGSEPGASPGPGQGGHPEGASWPAPFELPSSVPEDPSSSNQGLKNDFVRNILWTFEDIHMLVGSNMPIFGGGRYPAVSLRLRDNNKPINVLTGIDYWLDNLICNVPELVMCFHVNGIVQKYEMIKTEEIPNLENSNFSTKVIKDIAQNILSFLKSNCTKEGHTYWLFKASGSDIVKLYDLTTLCEETEDKYQNPFTMPVAILLYKVACNMMMKKNQNKKHYGTIRTLLLNCVKLLDKGRHPQIIASANFMLSELFQLDEPKKEENSPLNENSDESYSEDEEEPPDSDENGPGRAGPDRPDDSKAVAVIESVGELSVPEKYKSIHQIRPSCAFPVCHDTEERCRLVLGYVLEGLKSVDGSVKRESDLPAADPNTPIPLKYEDESASGGPQTLEKQMALFLDKMGSLEEGKRSSQSGMIPGSWQHKMKLQLILKSSKAYYVLSDAAMGLQKYGRALRYIKLALQSHDTYCCLCTNMLSDVLLFLSQYLTLCGDIQLMLAQNASNRAAYLEEFNYQTKEDQEILHSLHREASCQGFAWATDLSTDLECQLSVSCKCYEAANEILLFGDLKGQNPEHHNQVLKRMGNIRNEIGVFYMNQAAALQTERVASGSVSAAEQQLWKKSFSCFEQGIRHFEAIEDATNAALLLCNTGRLMRICAQAHCAAAATAGSQREFSPEEALYYHKAVDYYLKALRSLGAREVHPAVWDSVNWELSTTYFTMATLQQDYAPLSRKAQEQIEKEVSEAMMKSLKHCDVDTASARQPLCQYRAATIHHRLASMYHSCLRNQVGDEPLRKQHRVLAELHYGKAAKLFQLLRDAPCELLRVQLERVAFAEFHMASQNSNAGKLKTLSGALDVMMKTQQAFQLIRREFGEPDQGAEPPASGDPSTAVSREEVLKLLGIFESRLSFLLLQSIKLLSAVKKKTSGGGGEEEAVLKTNKRMYSLLLRASADRGATVLDRVDLILRLMGQLAPPASPQ